MMTWGAGIVLLFVINHAVSGQQSGLLSSLYKKAAEENRPMILVLDNGDDKHSSKNLQSSSGSKKEAQNQWPYNLLQDLGAHTHTKSQTRNVLDLSRSRSRSLRARENDRKWLRSYSERYDRNSRDDRDRRNRDRGRNDRDNYDRNYRDSYDRNNRDRYDREDRDNDNRDRRDRDNRDRRDRYRDERDRNDRNRYDDRRDKDRYDNRDNDRYDNKDNDRYDNRDNDKYDRNRDDKDRRYRDKYSRYDASDRDESSIDRTLRTLIEKTLNKTKDEEEDPHTKQIQTKVIKHLLRASNYFNCEAQDQCKSKCPKPKRNNCDNKCEKKFECEPEPEPECDECQQDDSCGGEDDGCNPSTRGIPYESEPGGCKRCKK